MPFRKVRVRCWSTRAPAVPYVLHGGPRWCWSWPPALRAVVARYPIMLFIVWCRPFASGLRRVRWFRFYPSLGVSRRCRFRPDAPRLAAVSFSRNVGPRWVLISDFCVSPRFWSTLWQRLRRVLLLFLVWSFFRPFAFVTGSGRVRLLRLMFHSFGASRRSTKAGKSRKFTSRSIRF